MTCPHQCQVKPVRAGQVPLIREAEGREDELERGGGGGGGGEDRKRWKAWAKGCNVPVRPPSVYEWNITTICHMSHLMPFILPYRRSHLWTVIRGWACEGWNTIPNTWGGRYSMCQVSHCKNSPFKNKKKSIKMGGGVWLIFPFYWKKLRKSLALQEKVVPLQPQAGKALFKGFLKEVFEKSADPSAAGNTWIQEIWK